MAAKLNSSKTLLQKVNLVNRCTSLGFVPVRTVIQMFQKVWQNSLKKTCDRVLFWWQNYYISNDFKKLLDHSPCSKATMVELALQLSYNNFSFEFWKNFQNFFYRAHLGDYFRFSIWQCWDGTYFGQLNFCGQLLRHL